MNKYKFFQLVSMSIIVTCLYNQTAMAYVDPGTGSFLLQMLAGGSAVVFVFLKIYWLKLKQVITSKIKTLSRKKSDKTIVNSSLESSKSIKE